MNYEITEQCVDLPQMTRSFKSIGGAKRSLLAISKKYKTAPEYYSKNGYQAALTNTVTGECIEVVKPGK